VTRKNPKNVTRKLALRKVRGGGLGGWLVVRDGFI